MAITMTRSAFAAAALLAALVLALPASAQVSDICGCEGHPESLGAFDIRDAASYPPGWVVNDGYQGTVTVPLPEDGILIFDSFYFGRTALGNYLTLSFERNAANTPVTLLVAGDFTLGGGMIISLDGQVGEAGNLGVSGVRTPLGGLGGPGGHRGGDGGNFVASGTGLGGAGFGPLGGAPGDANVASPAQGEVGEWAGPADLLPVTGGSGGGGGSTLSTSGACVNGAGGGGGGAILIAANGAIRVDGTLRAEGGGGGYMSNTGCAGRGGGGAGGSIRLVADTISGVGRLYTRGGSGGSGVAPSGRIRMEAYSNSMAQAVATPVASRALTPGPVALLGGESRVSITAIAGNVIAQPPTAWSGGIDLLLQLPDTVTVELETQNVPAGSLVDVTLKPRVGGAASVTSLEIDPGNCDSQGICVAFTEVDLAAGSYVLEAEATLVTPAP